MRTQHTFMLKKIGKISLVCHLTRTMINTHYLELPQSRTYGSKGVRDIEVLLYVFTLMVGQGPTALTAGAGLSLFGLF